MEFIDCIKEQSSHFKSREMWRKGTKMHAFRKLVDHDQNDSVTLRTWEIRNEI